MTREAGHPCKNGKLSLNHTCNRDLSASYFHISPWRLRITIDLAIALTRINKRALAIHNWLQAHRFFRVCLKLIVAYSLRIHILLIRPLSGLVV